MKQLYKKIVRREEDINYKVVLIHAGLYNMDASLNKLQRYMLKIIARMWKTNCNIKIVFSTVITYPLHNRQEAEVIKHVNSAIRDLAALVDDNRVTISHTHSCFLTNAGNSKFNLFCNDLRSLRFNGINAVWKVFHKNITKVW